MGRGDGDARVAPLLKRLLDVAWIGMISLGVLAGAAALLSLAGVGRMRIGVPFHFTLGYEAYAVSSAVLDVRDVRVQGAAGNLFFTTSAPATLAALALMMAFWGFVMLVLHQLRGLVASLAAGSPFVPGNATRIRFIGLAVIGMEAVRALAAFGFSVWLDRHLVTEGISARLAFPVRVELVLTGLAVLAIAGVFRRGTRLQEDHDLTV